MAPRALEAAYHKATLSPGSRQCSAGFDSGECGMLLRSSQGFNLWPSDIVLMGAGVALAMLAGFGL